MLPFNHRLLVLIGSLLPATFAHAQYSGAIAYSPSSGAYGYVRSAPDQGSAQAEALNACRASDCQIVAWVNDGCAALAAGYPASVYGWAWNLYSREDAVTAAMYECSLQGQGCRLVASLCTYWGG